MTPYHDRMPVLLRAEDFDAWLNGSLGADALRPAAESALREWPVSRRVNRAGVGEDDPTIIERVDHGAGQDSSFDPGSIQRSQSPAKARIGEPSAAVNGVAVCRPPSSVHSKKHEAGSRAWQTGCGSLHRLIGRSSSPKSAPRGIHTIRSSPL
jgi:hypothetical protein